MTILLVDAGNSRLKWVELDATTGSMSAQQAQAYGKCPAVDVFIGLLDRYPQVRQVTLVHVLAADFVQGIEAVCVQRHIYLTVVRSTEQAYGITSGYRQPQTLGADRFVGLVAAHRLACQKASIVIDCGTAVTIDAIEQDGRHWGGVILPGLQLSADALIARAQGKLSLSFEQPTVFADGTGRAIGGGCLFGLLGAIEGICNRMRQTLSTPLVCILTGGNAAQLSAWLPADYLLQPDLLMHGLRYITEQQGCTSY